ncbi:flagellar basal body-associated FliL family protein [Sulfurimonas sp.]|jgi:flagellar basal body-associated protein FliL|uniref:flagellar basal body-associated FliL family protein n=1 Tax=Sulfurimonas sp. TaxID=2022749 RepID=UPI002A36C3F2|nr:flagellar basal body-associated FliL family protein [Sulfurimonas sp.]MDY0123694.1 flagellar basal body-associated FliL family protein [Sulfurimonas sp.]
MKIEIDRVKVIKNAIIVVLSLITVLVLILGVLSSDFTKLQKYDVAAKSPRESAYNRTILSSLSNGMKVSISSDSKANLGDFVFNISGDKKLIANIAIKYKPVKDENSWFSDSDEIKHEILKKGVILRDATINTLLGYSAANANNEQMREKLKETLNKNLSSCEIEEVYFNQFIIQ